MDLRTFHSDSNVYLNANHWLFVSLLNNSLPQKHPNLWNEWSCWRRTDQIYESSLEDVFPLVTPGEVILFFGEDYICKLILKPFHSDSNVCLNANHWLYVSLLNNCFNLKSSYNLWKEWNCWRRTNQIVSQVLKKFWFLWHEATLLTFAEGD